MSSIVSGIFALFVVAPLISYIVAFIICKKITKKHRRSVRFAIDFSTIFFIFSVHYLAVTIWEKSFFWYIIIFVLCAGMIFTIYHWKVDQEVVFSKVFRGFWRLNFLVFLFVYLGLMVYGIVQRIYTTVSMPL